MITLSQLLADDQMAREHVEKENADLQIEIVEPKQLLKAETQKSWEVEKVSEMQEKLEALMENVVL